jgi:hypothetical protein
MSSKVDFELSERGAVSKLELASFLPVVLREIIIYTAFSQRTLLRQPHVSGVTPEIFHAFPLYIVHAENHLNPVHNQNKYSTKLKLNLKQK